MILPKTSFWPHSPPISSQWKTSKCEALRHRVPTQSATLLLCGRPSWSLPRLGLAATRSLPRFSCLGLGPATLLALRSERARECARSSASRRRDLVCRQISRPQLGPQLRCQRCLLLPSRAAMTVAAVRGTPLSSEALGRHHVWCLRCMLYNL